VALRSNCTRIENIKNEYLDERLATGKHIMGKTFLSSEIQNSKVESSQWQALLIFRLASLNGANLVILRIS
jgi:hypothetical protein